MKDQNSIDKKETSSQKYERALDLFTESVLKPDHDLRGCAHNQGCYDQLMEIREHVINYLKTLKEVTHHTNADESDEIETQKLAEYIHHLLWLRLIQEDWHHQIQTYKIFR